MHRSSDQGFMMQQQHMTTGSRTSSSLNLKVWTVDDEGNFIKTYPFHPPRQHPLKRRQRAHSVSAHLDHEAEAKVRQAAGWYAEIEKDVREKYFASSSTTRSSHRLMASGQHHQQASGLTTASSMDHLVTPFKPLSNRRRNTVSDSQEGVSQRMMSRSSTLPPPPLPPPPFASGYTSNRSSMTPMHGSFAHLPNSGQSTSLSRNQRSQSLAPIRSVTAKILHKLGDTVDKSSKRSKNKDMNPHPESELAFDQVLSQLQHMSSQQQYLQAQVVWQQQRFKEAMDLELMGRSSASSTSSQRKEAELVELKNQLHEQRMQRSLTRAQIQEQICSQQNKLSDHILRLQQQLDLLLVDRSRGGVREDRTEESVTRPPLPIMSSAAKNPSSSNNSHSNNSKVKGKLTRDQEDSLDQEENLILPPIDDDNEMRRSASVQQPPRPRTPVPGSSPRGSTHVRPSSVPPHHHYSHHQHMDSLDLGMGGETEDPDEIWINEVQSVDRLHFHPPIRGSGSQYASTFKPLSMMGISKDTEASESYENLFDEEDAALDLPPVDEPVVPSVRLNEPSSPTNNNNSLINSPEAEDRMAKIRREMREQEIDRELEHKKRQKEQQLQQELEDMELKMKAKQHKLIQEAERELQQVLKQSSRQQQEFEQHRLLIEQQERELHKRNELLQQQAQQQQMQQQVGQQQSNKWLPPVVPVRGRSGSLRPIRSKDDILNNSLLNNRSASDLSITRSSNNGSNITSLVSKAHEPIVQTASMVSRSMAQPPINRSVSPNPQTMRQNPAQLQAESQSRGRSRSPRPNQNMSPAAPPLPPQRLRSPSPVKSMTTASHSELKPNLSRTRSPSPRGTHVTFSDQMLDQSYQGHQQQQQNLMQQMPLHHLLDNSVMRSRTSSFTDKNHPNHPQQQQQQLHRPTPGQPLQLPQSSNQSNNPMSSLQLPGHEQQSQSQPQETFMQQLYQQQRHDQQPQQQVPPSPTRKSPQPQQQNQSNRSSSPSRPGRRRSVSPFRPVTTMTEAFMDHFDHYASVRGSHMGLAGSRAKLLKSRSRSKDPIVRVGAIRRSNSRSAVFLDEDSDPNAGQPVVDDEHAVDDHHLLSTPSSSPSSHLHSRIGGTQDDSILSSSSTSSPGRRQTLPELITKLDIETPSMSAAPKAGFSAAGLTGGLRGKKPLHDPTSQRKSSVPVVTPIAQPPEGWDREKVSAMAHEAREQRTLNLNKNKWDIDWRRGIRLLFYDRLALTMIAVNAGLLFFFYRLFQEPETQTSQEEDQEVVHVGRVSDAGRTALHDFLSNVFAKHRDSQESNDK